MTGSSDPHQTVFAGLRRDMAGPVNADRLAARVREELPKAGTAGALDVARRAQQELFGAGPLESLMVSPDVSDILVNGPGPVWVDRGHGVVDSGLRIDHADELRALAHRLVTACGRRLDDACPFADARLPDGTRVHAALAAVAGGISLTFGNFGGAQTANSTASGTNSNASVRQSQ